MNDSTEQVTRAAKAAAILGAILTVFALGIYGGRTAGGVLLGAAIGVVNLLTMRAIIRALLTAPEEEEDAAPDPNTDHKAAGKRGGIAWGIFAALKIVILFGGIWILLSKGLVDPMPLAVGYGVLPLGIAASSLFANLGPARNSKR